MQNGPNIARVGTLVGDTTRATMLSALMQGKALTASELARCAGITPQTASTHLAQLLQGGLVKVQKQGRHKYFALRGEPVAALLESMMSIVDADKSGKQASPKHIRTGPRDSAMRKARVCYNHLAGEMGIRLYDGLIAARLLVNRDGQLKLSRKGETMAAEFGIDLDALRGSRSPLCRECLDWSERRSHLAGSLGRALLERMETLKWCKREPGTRILRFSARGEAAFAQQFSL